MKSLFIICLGLLYFGLTGFSARQESNIFQGKTKETIVYLVRHAEKITSDPDNADPELTPAGYARAQALENYLKNNHVEVFFSTPYKRTRLTLEPIAAGREIKTYDAHGATDLRELILKEYNGKTILVAGHSNTLLPIIEAFGAKKPVATLADSKYDYIFKLTLRAGKKAKLETATYGAPSS